jgi:PAS domain S-box-containing protein
MIKGARILIVDDENDIALILRLHLEDAGYQTVTAHDGIEALEQLGRQQFDLVLLDIKMPRMDGVQALAEIQKRYPDTAAMMMTAHGSEAMAVETMQKGALDYLTKPFSTDDMLKRIERAIRYNRTRLDNELLVRQLREERNKTAAILQGLADPLVAVDGNCRIVMVNRQAEQFFGRSPDQLIGNELSRVLNADIPTDRLPCRVAMSEGRPCLDVSFNVAVEGRNVPVLSSATPLYGGPDELVGSVAIIRDVSALRALEQEREDFVSMLSHDLKTPITAVTGSIELVRDGKIGGINAEQKEYLDSAMESCAEIMEMVDTLLDVHRFEAGKMNLLFREEDIVPLTARIVERYRPVAERSQQTLTFSLAEPVPPLSIDRNTFVRLVGNLLSNALKFTPEEGTIDVSIGLVRGLGKIAGRIPSGLYPPEQLRGRGCFVSITVKDSGEGIPTDALAGIFDRFVQVANRRRGKSTGSGLGLAFCRKVMNAHGGYIWAESDMGRGSRFTALFPLETRQG